MSQTFSDYLSQLPSIDHIEHCDILDENNTIIASIPNQTGKQGSLKVYNGLLEQFGELNTEAATTALTWFAEHVQDAKDNPGKHPNIDRLFDVIEQNQTHQLVLMLK